MAEKDNNFDVSKMGDTVIRDADSGSKPDLPNQDSNNPQKNPYQFKKPDKMNNHSGPSYRHKNDTTFDVSKMGDTVIRDSDSDIPHEHSKEESSSADTEHPFKYQEPSPKGKDSSSEQGRLPPEIDDSM